MTDEDEFDRFLAAMRGKIEDRIREQLARHHRVDPNIDPRRVIDIQIKQERERLERSAEKFDDEGNDKIAELCRSLAEEWLPELSQKLQRQRR